MPAPTTTHWKLQPHTAAKHKILKHYLDAWIPILTRWHSRVVIIDGFAGPGRYEDGEPGSPIIVLEALLQHRALDSRRVDIDLICIEEDAERYKELVKEIDLLKGRQSVPKNIRPTPIRGTFATEARRMLNDGTLQGAPVFAFIDPFGFAGVPLSVIRDLADFPRCDCLINFAYESVNRWVNHPDDALLANFDELFGTTEWRAVNELGDPAERRQGFLNLYARQLKNVCAFQYVLSFEMVNEGARTEYFLVFATRSDEGLSKMKDAMWRIDPDSGSMFSDRTDASQARLLTLDGGAGLRPMLLKRFRGKGLVRIEDIEDYVLKDTPYSETKHLKTKTLQPLEKTVPPLIRVAGARKRKGTYPPGTLVEFLD